MLNKLTQLLPSQGFGVVSTADSLDNLSTLLHKSAFDMAIVHGGAQGAQNAFYLLDGFWGIPVVFMMGRKESDWQKLKLLNAYAYIPEEAGETELIIRLKAAYRRFPKMNDRNITTAREYIDENREDRAEPKKILLMSF